MLNISSRELLDATRYKSAGRAEGATERKASHPRDEKRRRPLLPLGLGDQSREVPEPRSTEVAVTAQGGCCCDSKKSLMSLEVTAACRCWSRPSLEPAGSGRSHCHRCWDRPRMRGWEWRWGQTDKVTSTLPHSSTSLSCLLFYSSLSSPCCTHLLKHSLSPYHVPGVMQNWVDSGI